MSVRESMASHDSNYLLLKLYCFDDWLKVFLIGQKLSIEALLTPLKLIFSQILVDQWLSRALSRENACMLQISIEALWLQLAIISIIYAKFARQKLRILILSQPFVVVIADAQDAYTAANSCLQKHFAYDFAKLWLGNGLLIAPG